jgi:hypothetical protein
MKNIDIKALYVMLKVNGTMIFSKCFKCDYQLPAGWNGQPVEG